MVSKLNPDPKDSPSTRFSHKSDIYLKISENRVEKFQFSIENDSENLPGLRVVLKDFHRPHQKIKALKGSQN